jgi:type III pantothenate kinase
VLSVAHSSEVDGPVLRIVADLGNSRLKWGRVDSAAQLEATLGLPTEDSGAWSEAWERWNPGGARASEWAVSTVNPRGALRLRGFLRERGITAVRWFRSAAEVPIRHVLERAETAGADRALAVAAAHSLHPAAQPGIVVSCGSAVTVERVAEGGVWQGGAIAPGLGLSARALHLLTAQLPLVRPRENPPAWGRATVPALEAGLYWGVVGAIRELVTRQAAEMSTAPWLVWTGGDAPILAPAIAWEGAKIIPDLVLLGLIHATSNAPAR